LLLNAHLPAGWLPERALPGASPSTSAEDAWYDQQLVVQTTGANSSLAKTHKNPFFRFVLWAAARGKPVDIDSILEVDLARFAVALNMARRNKSASASAVDAVSFFIDHRKNDTRWTGHYFDVPFGDRLTAYRGLVASDIFLASKARFLTGPLLRRVWRRGRAWHLAPRFIEDGPDAGESATMPHSDFHSLLRAELVASSGFSSSLALEYSSHGGRAAAASTLSRACIPPGQINDRAGVVSADWLAGYDRLDPERRFETVRALRFG
jgi:hypothetical protein